MHIAINPVGDRWVSCGDNGISIVWSIDGRQIAKLPVVGPVSNCRFSDDGRWLATLSESGAINIWESETGKPMGPTIQGKSRIEFLEWAGDRIVFGGNNVSGYWVSDLKLPDEWIAP